MQPEGAGNTRPCNRIRCSPCNRYTGDRNELILHALHGTKRVLPASRTNLLLLGDGISGRFEGSAACQAEPTSAKA